MPAGAPYVRPRFPQAPFPMTNGTNRATTAEARAPTSREQSNKKPEPTQTPSSIPTPSYLPVQVVAASDLPSTITTHSTIPRYEGSNAIILQGYCTEPGYTILDGATVLWVPVVGCISSKAECCPTSTIDEGGNTAPTTERQNADPGAPPNVAATGVGRAAFPVSSLPSQGLLTGCPQDYHTVTGTAGLACCPSSYWLWTSQLGGQIPCYSSLGQALMPPPIPDTLINLGRMTETGGRTVVPSSRATAQTLLQKPTLAVVNIAYAMQYQLAAETDPPSTGLKKEAKIGIGVGAAGASLLIAAVLAFFLWRRFKQRSQGELQMSSASQRFNSQVDMSRVAHKHPGIERMHGA